jgi:ATP-dependent Zn protease
MPASAVQDVPVRDRDIAQERTKRTVSLPSHPPRRTNETYCVSPLSPSPKNERNVLCLSPLTLLDELDAVLKQRSGAGSSHEEDNKVVAEFLNGLQSTSDHDVLFIGATNRIDALDDAGIRAGRIDKKIHIGKPDQETREAILRTHLHYRPSSLSDDQIELLAARTEGRVAAELESLVTEAARVAAFERDGDVIQFSDMQRVLDSV